MPRYFRTFQPFETMRIMFGHCRPDSIVGIGSRRPTAKGVVAPHWLYACRVCRLDTLWASITQYEMHHTKYLIQNPLLSTALSNGTVEEYEQEIVTGVPIYFRATNRNVSELANIIVDLDVGRSESDVTAEEALEYLSRRILCGEFPIPTFVGFSGRGLYVVYTLRDAHGRAPIRTRDSEAQWKSVSRALISLMSDLNSDGNAMRTANWFKLPGTVDTCTERTVEYGIIRGVHDTDQPVLYTLQELQQVLNTRPFEAPPVEEPRTPVQSKYEPNRDTRRERSRSSNYGYTPDPSAPHRKRAAEIRILNESRGGMTEGCRYLTVRHYFLSRRAELRSDRVGPSYHETEPIALKDAMDLNETFRPPLSTDEVHRATRDFGQSKRYLAKNETVAADLCVTEQEVSKLGLEMLLPSDVVAARRAKSEAQRASRAALRNTTLAMLRKGASVSSVAKSLKITPQRVGYWKRKLERETERTPPA